MRDELLEFELSLDLKISDEVIAHDWGRVFLCPTLPLVWDLNWALVEQEGMTALEVIAAADEALAAFNHRAVAIRGEADGARLAAEFAHVPDWEVETTIYMLWRGETEGRATSEVRETPIAGCDELRRELIYAGLSEKEAGGDREATTEQLLEMDRRFAAASGDRWFVAPPEEPASACCLLSGDGIGQVEEVGTLAAARGRGYAQATVLAAARASREAGHRVTFLSAEADDWPRRMYEKLGFEPGGTMHVLRRTSHQG
ncbi:MAG TPA: GNAT family N-acetyltransferase [Solirubrobacterales bacterium]|nr:GNAT family N-acetyltransferase [Solirubrobacterales bacterium]